MTPPPDPDDCVHVDLPEGDGFKCVICDRVIGPPEITVGKGLEAVRAVRQMLHPDTADDTPSKENP